MTLSELKTGEKGIIVKINGRGNFRKRIIEMGFIRGKTVSVILDAPLMDPVEYEVMKYKVSLRRAEAAQIEIISEADAIASLHQTDKDLKALNATKNDLKEYDQLLQDRMEKLAKEKSHTINVALVGNPNCGKTSLFNIASGAHEHVGNYSGVTVGAAEGQFDFKSKDGNTYHIKLVDLPGTYSLSAYSPEETYVRRQLLDHTPDVVVNVLDTTNIERNLYLTTQLIDMHIKRVCALNMYDEFEKSGDKLNVKELSLLLGCPFVPTICRSGKGLDQLFETVIEVYQNNNYDNASLQRHIHINHGKALEHIISLLTQALRKNENIRYQYSSRYLAIEFLLHDKEVENIIQALPNHDELIAIRFTENKNFEAETGETIENAMIDAKYGFIQGTLKEVYTPAKTIKGSSLTDKIDAIVTHRWLSFPIFFLFLAGIFEATFTLGQYPMDWIEELVGILHNVVGDYMPNGALKDLITDGIINGVGAVIVFLPNILILYFFISLLEDSGYMARAAFIMDKLMHHMGLHGKSFIPMIMGFGCNVPAVMATRTIENPKSRLITMLVVPMMSCSARIPIYILLLGTFFPKNAGLIMLGLYLFGMLMAVIMAKLFSKCMTKSIDLPFVMELPPYRIPMAKSIFRHTWEKGRQYLYKMGHIILVACVIIWALNYYPEGFKSEEQQAKDRIENVAPQQSYIAHIGHAMEPLTRPLGFDWKMNVGILAGTPAKELVVSTMGVLYSNDTPEEAEGNEDELATDKRLHQALLNNISQPAAISYLIFILLYFPCIATIATIKGESGKWKWALFTAFYTTALAYIMSFAAYRIALYFM